MIWNKIMIHFGHPKPIINNKKPKDKLNKMLFSILDSELNDDFYFKKLKLNPSKKASPIGFKQALEKWIQSGSRG
jgi:hypothetical protein